MAGLKSWPFLPIRRVLIDDEPVGVTPTFVDLPRRERDLALRLEKEGFAAVDVPVGRSLSGWLWGDAVYTVATGLMAGQAIGGTQWAHVFPQAAAFVFGIDLLTGAAFGRPHHVQATLERRLETASPLAVPASSATREGLVLPVPPVERLGDGHARTDVARGRER